MIIEGVKEDEKLSLSEIVDLFLEDLNVDFDSTVCDWTYRRGKKPS